jgi:hypothetical protein
MTVEFKIDWAQGREFISLMREVRLIYLRNGAYSWRFHEDLTRSNTFRLVARCSPPGMSICYSENG